MIHGQIEHRIIDDKVFINFDDLIQALYVTAHKALDVAEVTSNETFVIQTTGVIEVAKGLDEILDTIKQHNGLARWR